MNEVGKIRKMYNSLMLGKYRGLNLKNISCRYFKRTNFPNLENINKISEETLLLKRKNTVKKHFFF